MSGREALPKGAVNDEKERELMIPLVDPTASKVIQVESIKNDLENTDETQCGFGIFRGTFLQKFATANSFAIVYGMLGCIFSASYAYSNGAITTMEKRFRIPSKTIGIIAVGNDVSQVFASLALSYYAGKGHRPRWIGFGTYTFVAFCLMTTMPHFLYGPGEDALSLTKEYADRMNMTSESMNRESMKKLCLPGQEGLHCEETESNAVTISILIAANFISGVGGTLFYSVGTAYMDDNIQRDRSPVLLSFSFFLRTMGVALGYSLASLCLRFYISPTLTPLIPQEDPRWMGAWWIGWLVLGFTLMILGFSLSLFPNVLPEAAARKTAALRRALSRESNGTEKEEAVVVVDESSASFKDMLRTVRRLVSNKVLMCVHGASIFYTFGYMPYWVFMPKYIETQYRQSASFSSLITGTAGLVFSAMGILLTGYIITRWKPSARHMALWNTLIGVASVAGIISYAFLGCGDNSSYQGLIVDNKFQATLPCNSQCDCEFVPYAPICTATGKTFISACHAGCTSFRREGNVKTYTNCSCIPPADADPVLAASWNVTSPGWEHGGEAISGACPKDCSKVFLMFLSVVCLLKFVGATGRATNFFVSVRCVEDKDKPVAMGLGITLMSFFTFVPAPIVFGYLMDTTCLVWGQTCSSQGNCWLYDDEAMRKVINATSAALIAVSVAFDFAIWFFVKDLKIFDEPDPTTQEAKPKKET